jgi:Uma2 family endonuclease
MTTKTLMTVEEYLHTSFEDGDCEYVDGEIVEKNIGEYGHADIQGELVFLLRSLRSKPGLETLKAMPEVRIRTGPSRYRVPDVAVWLRGETGVRIPTLAPFLAIEILSPDDRMTRVKIKIEEYLSIGTQWIWLVDPDERKALRTENPKIEISIERILAGSDL